MLEALVQSAVVGIGATALIDAWSLTQKRLFGLPGPDFRLVGRWVAHMGHAQFAHDRIAAAPAVPREAALGWATHYGTGVVFAGLLATIAGPEWLERPTPGPALIFGLATVAAPFLIMQPALGHGFAASKAPKPGKARLRSLTTHLVFGVGLYLSAALAAAVSG